MTGWGMAALLSGHRDLPEEKCRPRSDALIRSATPSPSMKHSITLFVQINNDFQQCNVIYL